MFYNNFFDISMFSMYYIRLKYIYVFMEKITYNESLKKDNETGKFNQALWKVVFITALLTSSIISGDSSKWQYRDLDISEEISSSITHKTSKVKRTGKNLSSEILEEYETRKNSNGVELVKKETQNFVKWLLSKFWFVSYNEKKDDVNGEVDMYLLSRISKEYLDKHKVTIIWKESWKAFLLAYYKKSKSWKAEIIYLPIQPINPNNETLRVHKWTTVFSISPSQKSNWYNTEYDIKSSDWWRLYQLSILYPAEYGEYSKQLKNKEILEAEKKDLEKQEKEFREKSKGKSGNKLLWSKIKKLDVELNEQKKKLAEIKNFHYFSYIPYTQLHDNYDNQERWLSYLIREMQVTYASIFWKRLSDYWSTIPWLSIWESIPENFPLVLNIVERMDFLVYFEKDWKTLKDKKIIDSIMVSQVNQALTTFWLNKNEAFNWQKSNVWAEWVGQVMPWTYNLFRNHEKYKGFFPENDFSKAAKDHNTTFRLQVSHFDDQICQIPLKIRQNWWKILQNEDTKIWLNALLAAGYNWNMKRVVSDVFAKIWPKDWIDDYKKRLLSKNIIEAMKKARDVKISSIEREISILYEKIRSWTLSEHQIKNINAQIKDKKDQITSINNTYKESMTYVLKTEFVVTYLGENFWNEFKYN